jgi:mRNA interferase HigB
MPFKAARKRQRKSFLPLGASLRATFDRAVADVEAIAKASHSPALRRALPSADLVGKLTVFNLGGNTVHLIAAIHYNRGKVYIRAVLMHAEYDKGTWKE